MDLELNKHISFILKSVRDNYKHSFCFLNNSECSDKIIQAHSIQNSRYLKNISDNGNVYAFQKSDEDIFKLEMIEIGRGKASTFPGFCGYHDSTIFSSLENQEFNPNNLMHSFLLYYRAFAREFHAKQYLYESIKYLLNIFNDKTAHDKFFIKGKPTEKMLNSMISSYNSAFKGTQDSINSGKELREVLNISLRDQRFDRVFSKVIEIKGFLPITASSFFYPDYNTDGVKINFMEDISKKIYPMSISVLPEKDKGLTYCILSTYKKNKHLYEKSFIDLSRKKEIELKKMISSILLVFCENLYINPTYWNNLSDDTKKNAINIFNHNMHTENSLLNKYYNINIL